MLESGKCCGSKKGSRVGVIRNAGLGKASCSIERGVQGKRLKHRLEGK